MNVLGTVLTYPREAIGATLLGVAGLFAAVGLSIAAEPSLTGTASASTSVRTTAVGKPPAPEPLAFKNVSMDDARTINAAVPFSASSNPAARPLGVKFPDRMNEARALDCLTAAVYYEAAIEGADGQRAVAQVVLNRLRHPAYPKTVCGVVFQGSERATGCQFTFTCDGALRRTPIPALWNRAREIAWGALSGQVFAAVGWSTHYHTDWVVPYWASSLAKATKVGTHIFYRWMGGWGRPPAFAARYAGVEPGIAKLASLSGAHGIAEVDLATASGAALDALAENDPIVVEAAGEAGRQTMRLDVAGGGAPATTGAGTPATPGTAAAAEAAQPNGAKLPWELRWALTGAGADAPEPALGNAVAPATKAAAASKDCATPTEISVKANGTDGAAVVVREKCGA